METKPATSAGGGSALLTHADAIRIREALDDVLQSPPFRGSRQCQTLLTYVVERTLAGENDHLRERVIGAEVFARGPAYEPSEDPIVRVRAAEVRKRLAQYYQKTIDSPIRIDIPPGSYKATFQFTAVQSASPAVVKSPSGGLRWAWLVAGVVATAAIVMAVRGMHLLPPSALDLFWEPALASPKPILIYNAATTVFRPLDGPDSAHDMVAVHGQYTCIGDAYASVVLGALFSRKGKLYQMRYGTDLSFGDLRYQPSILIGAFNNTWTLQTTNELRFIFDKHPTIRDRSNNRLYTLLNLTPEGRTPEDYAIVSRVFDSKTGELLIAAAGITQYGTRGSGGVSDFSELHGYSRRNRARRLAEKECADASSHEDRRRNARTAHDRHSILLVDPADAWYPHKLTRTAKHCGRPDSVGKSRDRHEIEPARQ